VYSSFSLTAAAVHRRPLINTAPERSDHFKEAQASFSFLYSSAGVNNPLQVPAQLGGIFTGSLSYD